MANLGDTAVVARKAILYGGIGLIFLMVGRIILTTSYAYWKSIHPDPPPPPDVKFGKLPKLVFPQKDAVSLQYQLQTSTGGLPAGMPGQFKVFFMPIKKANLLAYDSAKTVANRLDFIQDPKKLSESEYRWDVTDPIPSSLTINIVTGSFILDRKWQNDPAYLTPNMYYTDSQSLDRMYNLLSRVELLPEDIKDGNNTIQYLKADKDQIVSAVSLSQADFVQVNLYRKPVDNVEVVSPRTDRGLISAILALQRDDNKQFVHLDYNYFPVDLETSAVYPLIGVAEAWKRMQNGGGYVAGVKPSVTNVTVRSVTLGYYDAEDPQQFMQPVYVFRGDDDFVGYVSAVTDTWVQ